MRKFTAITVLLMLALACTPRSAGARSQARDSDNTQLAQATSAVTENRHAVAVVIGNKNYFPGVPAVDFAHADAEAMKRFVIEVLGYRDGNIIDLRDATRAQLDAVFGTDKTYKGRLYNWIRSGKSDVVVFYSGHGVPGLKDRRGYLLPVDGDPNFAEITGYPVDQLYANLAKISARSVTVYLDACFSGNSPKGLLIRATSGISVMPKAPKTGSGLTVLTAARGDQVASWDEEAKHGLFTKHLLEALYGSADRGEYGDGDDKVTVAEVLRYLDDEMTYQARRRYGREQQASLLGDETMVLATLPPEAVLLPEPPAIGVEEMDATYVAVKTSNVRAQPSVQSEKVGRLITDTAVKVTGKVAGKQWYRVAHAGGTAYVFAPLLKAVDAAEVAAWEQVKASEEPEDFEAFLRTHPAGHYAERAKRLMAVLRPPPAPVVPTPREVQPAVGVYPPTYEPGTTFKDCSVCPDMVVVPAGSFMMGSPPNEAKRYKDEGPQHRVTIPKAFAVGKYEVTFKEWDACIAAGGCGGYRPKDEGWGRGQHPVIYVNWDDAKAYVDWLSRQTGKRYRLLSEAEWEYAARAGTATPFSTGRTITTDQANFDGNYTYGGSAKGASRRKTLPVGSFAANGFGLHDLHGNVYEWVEDCWHGNYAGAPTGGRAWTSGGDCGRRVLRGGSWNNYPWFLRSAYRIRNWTDYRNYYIGLRVARTVLR